MTLPLTLPLPLTLHVTPKVRTLLRRDPNFVDGTALLATLRWSQGDKAGATTAYASLCDTPIWCETYASDAAVLGRWTP